MEEDSGTEMDCDSTRVMSAGETWCTSRTTPHLHHKGNLDRAFYSEIEPNLSSSEEETEADNGIRSTGQPFVDK